MKNIEVPVSTIGHGTVSPEEMEIKRYKREVLTAIGLTVPYIDCGVPNKTKVVKRLNTERFSTNYKTREEFDKDRILVADLILDDKKAPEDLIKKVAETVSELNLQFGE